MSLPVDLTGKLTDKSTEGDEEAPYRWVQSKEVSPDGYLSAAVRPGHLYYK